MSDCNHIQCDLCGVRSCQGPLSPIEKWGSLVACRLCVVTAVRHAYDACCAWGNIFEKPCGNRARQEGTER